MKKIPDPDYFSDEIMKLEAYLRKKPQFCTKFSTKLKGR